jgi:hypothetical protein
MHETKDAKVGQKRNDREIWKRRLWRRELSAEWRHGTGNRRQNDKIEKIEQKDIFVDKTENFLDPGGLRRSAIVESGIQSSTRTDGNDGR